jgi:transcriptional regulator with XRE-family HTH domain
VASLLRVRIDLTSKLATILLEKSMQQASGNSKLAALVSEWTQSSGKTLKEIAEKSGINASHLSLIKSGKRGISEAAARRLADALYSNDQTRVSAASAELIEAANANRDVAFPVIVTTTVQLKVPAHSVGLFGELQSKIQTKEILTKSALIEFERAWDIDGEIYIYAEQHKALEIHDAGFLRLTRENITERHIKYHFAFGDADEAALVGQLLSVPATNNSPLNIYRRAAKRNSQNELRDLFEKRRICIIYTAPAKSPVVYEKVLDEPMLFHRVGAPDSIALLEEFKANLKKKRWKKL